MKEKQYLLEHTCMSDLKENLKHISISLDGLLQRIDALESHHQNQKEINSKLAICIDLLADELDLEITELPSAES